MMLECTNTNTQKRVVGLCAILLALASCTFGSEVSAKLSLKAPESWQRSASVCEWHSGGYQSHIATVGVQLLVNRIVVTIIGSSSKG
eukprot:6325664-Amphidinium_carterae.1